MRFLTAAYCLIALGGIGTAFGTPMFARETKLPCTACHSQPPRLNEFGQRFYANRFRLPGNRKLALTFPFWFTAAICISGDTAIGRPTPGNKIDIAWDDNLVGSTGYIAETQTMYHFVYVPIVHTERTYLTQPVGGHFSVQAGNISMTSQLDPRLDLTSFEPEVLAPHGSSYGRFSPFAPDGVAVGVRVSASTGNSLPYSDGTTLAVTAPLSNEIAGGGYNGVEVPSAFSKTPNGAYVEAFNRKGQNSTGISGFFGKDGRRYYGFYAQRKFGKFYAQGGAAYDQWPFGITRLGTVGIDYRLNFNQVYGIRLDQQDGKTSIVPTMSFMLNGRDNAPSLSFQELVSHGTKPQILVNVFWRF